MSQARTPFGIRTLKLPKAAGSTRSQNFPGVLWFAAWVGSKHISRCVLYEKPQDNESPHFLVFYFLLHPLLHPPSSPHPYSRCSPCYGNQTLSSLKKTQCVNTATTSISSVPWERDRRTLWWTSRAYSPIHHHLLVLTQAHRIQKMCTILFGMLQRSLITRLSLHSSTRRHQLGYAVIFPQARLYSHWILSSMSKIVSGPLRLHCTRSAYMFHCYILTVLTSASELKTF